MNIKAAHDVTGGLARLALGIDFADLPTDVVTRSRHCLLDWLSVLIAGWQDDAVQILLDEVRAEEGPERATLLGGGGRVSVNNAALVNGTAGHVLDFDDVHLRSRVHPSVPLWSAIIALAERHNSSFEQMIASFVAGVEIQSRIGILMGEGHYAKGWHNTSTLGIFGATVAAGHLRGLDEMQMRHALGIAASQSGGLRSLFGTMCKPLQVGRAAMNGVVASGLAKRGFKAQVDIFDRANGFQDVMGNQLNPVAALAKSTDFEVSSIIFKWSASCYGTHAPIAAAKAIAPGLSDMDAIEAIEIFIEPQYMSVCNIAEPANSTEAKFSVRHAVALALAGWNTADEGSFSLQAVNDPQLSRLRQLTCVTPSDMLPRANASVKVQLADASTITQTADASRAGACLETEAKQLAAKTRAVTSGWLTQDAAEKLVSEVLNVDSKADVASLVHSLCRVIGK